MAKLFNALNELVENNDAFYYTEQEYLNRYIIRSYSYRLATYSDFQLPYAKDARGTAFIYDKETKEWKLFTRAYKKFFNLGEGEDINKTISTRTPIRCFDKLDGSLILVGRVDNTLLAKSKTSINSDQARMAQKLLGSNKKLQKFCHDVIDKNYTPVFELIGPDNIVVVKYSKNKLVLLGLVKNDSYDVITPDKLDLDIDYAKSTSMTWDELLNFKESCTDTQVEGYVVLMDNNDFVKVKTNYYVNRHHLKDSIDNLKNLIPLILDDKLDDIFAEFSYDKDVLGYIMNVQETVAHKFNELVQELITLRKEYFEKYKENRKEFALANKNKRTFGLVMRSLREDDAEKYAEKAVKEYILKICSSASRAKEFIQ